MKYVLEVWSYSGEEELDLEELSVEASSIQEAIEKAQQQIRYIKSIYFNGKKVY